MIAWGKESFTVEGCGLEGGCEFALVFELADGVITRLLVVEDLPAFVRGAAVRPAHRSRAAWNSLVMLCRALPGSSSAATKVTAAAIAR